MDIADSIYPGGFHSLMRRMEKRRMPFRNAGLEIPAADADLDRLCATLVTASAEAEPEAGRLARSRITRKWHEICQEFEGRPELFARHALAIAVLRRDNPPKEARGFFLRLWSEKGQLLAEELEVRWLISAASTFADHGTTIEQRLAGQGCYMLFDLIKLHDSERRMSGRPNHKPFAGARRNRDALAFSMVPYSLRGGDLDRNMLARLWQLAESDPVFRPLGFRMLRMVMTDKRTVFARIQRHRKRKAEAADG